MNTWLLGLCASACTAVADAAFVIATAAAAALVIPFIPHNNVTM